MTNKDARERARLLRNLMEVVQFLVMPETCYHSYIERYFEHGEWNDAPKHGCGSMCSACLNETKQFTGAFFRKQVIDVLSRTFFGKVGVAPDALKNALKLAKSRIFHPGHVPGTNTSQIHALLLQLVARNIITISVNDSTMVGTDALAKKHVTIQLAIGEENGIASPAYIIEDMWHGMTYDDSV
jgi:hypothetical protein